ncbi:MAG TPA: hypothetical protein VGI74_11735 [Streptosporangiaceae bacterium]|jgi:hypothetical protein
MSITRQSAARRVRTGLAAAAITGAGIAGLLGVSSAASASTISHARTDGWSVVTTCTGLSGKITYSPGMLTIKKRSVHAVMTGTTSGCSNINAGAFSGTGTFTAILSGTASVHAENFSGTFTINWPAGSGFNPSNGSISVTEANGLETVSGSVTSGAWTSAVLGGQYVTTGNTGKGTVTKPVKAQTYTNTQPLNLSENFG